MADASIKGLDLAEDYLAVITDHEIEAFTAGEPILSKEMAAAIPRIQAAILERTTHATLGAASLKKRPTRILSGASRRGLFDKILLNCRRLYEELTCLGTDQCLVSADTSRRHFLASVFGLAAAAFYRPRRMSTWPEHVLSTLSGIQESHLTTSPELMADKFLKAGSGELMSYYQLFFPSVLIDMDKADWEAKGNKIITLKRICESRAEVKQRTGAWWRLRALPSVAVAHTISSAQANEVEDLQSMLSDELKRSIVVEPQLEVVEIIFQNLTASLLQSPFDWKFLRAGNDVVLRAEELCKAFAKARPDTLLFLGPAVAAWQFLLTYEQALIGRGDEQAARFVAETMKRVKRSGGGRFCWLEQLDTLYGGCVRYEEMPPHTSVNVMRRSHLEKGRGRAVADYFTIVRLQEAYDNHLLAQGHLGLTSQREARRVGELEKGIFGFCLNFGITAASWKELKPMAEALLIPESLKYSEHLFGREDQGRGIETAEAPLAPTLADDLVLHSHRNLGEIAVTRQVIEDKELTDRSRDRFASAGSDSVEKVVGLCWAAAEYGARFGGVTGKRSGIEDGLVKGLASSAACQHGVEKLEEIASEL